jgi:hypothetical protein
MKLPLQVLALLILQILLLWSLKRGLMLDLVLLFSLLYASCILWGKDEWGYDRTIMEIAMGV